jgi:hypothetical protein
MRGLPGVLSAVVVVVVPAAEATTDPHVGIASRVRRNQIIAPLGATIPYVDPICHWFT